MDPKEQEKKVNDYIKKYLKKGYPKESLKKTLIDFGYSKSVVNKVFSNYEGKKEGFFAKIFKKKETAEKPKKEITLKEPHKWSFLIIVILLIVVIASALFFISTLPKDCGVDKQCFIENAQLGKYVIVKEDVVGSTLQYSNKDNVITKQFVAFSADEPAEIITLLNGKKMECPYTLFDQELINGFFGGLDKCSGDLLDTVYELEIV
jgi:hypothetical protein